jgi:MFS family permease
VRQRPDVGQDQAAGDSPAVPFIIGAALFLQTLDGQAIATVLPAAAASFGVPPLTLNLALAIYFAGAAAFLPISGWCADRFGSRTTLQAAIVGFMIGSAICGISSTPTELMAGRLLQGISGAGLLPVGRLILLRTSTRSELVQRLTNLTIPPLLGPLVGPLLGGAAATYASWRLIFALNIAVGLAGLALVRRLVPNLTEPHQDRFDWLGTIASALCLTSLVFLLERIGHRSSSASIDLFLLAFSAGSAAVYRWHYRRAPAPILDFSLLKLPTFRAGTVGGIFFRLSIGAEPFLYAMLFQVGMGYSALTSGMLTLATSIGMVAMRTTSVRLIRRLGFRPVLLVNTWLCATTLAIPATFTRSTPFALLVAVLLGRGFLRSLQLNALNSITYAEPPKARMSAASSVAATIQQVAQGMSLAAAATLIALAQRNLEFDVREAIGFAFCALALFSLFSLPFFYRLAGDAGAELTGAASPPATEEA